MSTFILTWNPKHWNYPDKDYQAEVAATARGEMVPSQWSTGGRKKGMAVNDRFYLLRQGKSGRGIVGSGYLTSETFQESHWDGARQFANYVHMDFETVVHTDDRLDTEDLIALVPEVSWNTLRSSGVKVSVGAEQPLARLWSQHVEDVGVPIAEEVSASSGYPEGSVQRVVVNRYERSRRARQICIAKWGTSCVVCKFDFEDVYGKLGSGFIHVHHVVELSTVGANYRVDAEKDLRPVCPNCHAMLHQRRPALTPALLKGRVARAAKN